ncbi:MAG: hypothetical protein F2837_10310, partial [Actinobacteria bacterium]|nr:hypothetical protein [Actinomycetota bacterium]
MAAQLDERSLLVGPVLLGLPIQLALMGTDGNDLPSTLSSRDLAHNLSGNTSLFVESLIPSPSPGDRFGIGAPPLRDLVNAFLAAVLRGDTPPQLCDRLGA